MPAAYTKRLSGLFDSCYRASAAKIADCRFGKVLLRYLEELGLVELGSEGIARVVHGGDPVLRYVDQDLAANRRCGHRLLNRVDPIRAATEALGGLTGYLCFC